MRKIFTTVSLFAVALAASAQAQHTMLVWNNNAVEVRTTQSTDSITFALPDKAIGIAMDQGELTSASLEATVTYTLGFDLANGAATERGVCYSATNALPTVDDETVTGGQLAGGAWQATLQPLQRATTYHCRPYAKLGTIVYYGDVQTFTTTGEHSITYTVSSDVFTAEKLPLINGLALLPDGRLAVAQRNDDHRVVAIDPTENTKTVLVNTYAGSFPWTVAANDGKLYVAYKAKGEVGMIDLAQGDAQDVQVVLTGLPNVLDIKFDTEGNMYVLCRDERKIYKYAKGHFTNDGKTTYASITGGEGIYCMDFDGSGNLFFGSQRDGIYMTTPDGTTTKIAGSGNGSTDGEPGQPMTMQLVQPGGLAVDKSNGDIYFSDSYNNKIRCIRKGDNGYTDASVFTVAGTGKGGKADGAGAQAQVNFPVGLAMTADNSTLYFVDMNNQVVRKIAITKQ